MVKKRRTWLRIAIDTMHIQRTGNAVADKIKICGALGSSIAESCAVLELTVAELEEIMQDKRTITLGQRDWLVLYIRALWWWHCWRECRRESSFESYLLQLASDCAPIWGKVPRQLRQDWRSAYEDRIPDMTPPRS
mgnify:FL=1